jgi:hypothetical protein
MPSPARSNRRVTFRDRRPPPALVGFPDRRPVGNIPRDYKEIRRMFVHFVLFWMKPGTSDASRTQLVEDCKTYLGKVPTVRNLWSGPPAMTPREVVDNTYDVALCVVLDDVAGHDVYQEHPLHKEFIARNKEHWQRVQIYDFK